MERIQELLRILGSPESSFLSVHVAGTNGKGSTAYMLASVLQQAGYKVGRFISPHVFSYRERINIDGKDISYDKFCTYLELLEEAISANFSQDMPTEFEILTAIAFMFFCDEQVDIAIIEVGMGGLYDSTNVIMPLLTIITNIDFDHMSYLGTDRRTIAANKAGIIKKNAALITGNIHDEAWPVISAAAKLNNAQVFKSEAIKICKCQGKSAASWGIEFSFQGDKSIVSDFPLRGDYQLENLAPVLMALQVLNEKGFQINKEQVTLALAAIHIPARLEILKYEPLIIADAAHNPHGAEALAGSLETMYPNRNRVIICTLLDDKDKNSYLEPLLKGTRAIVFTNPGVERSLQWMNWPELQSENLYWEEEMEAAFAKGLKLLEENDYLLITGSFYLMAPAIRWAKKLDEV